MINLMHKAQLCKMMQLMLEGIMGWQEMSTYITSYQDSQFHVLITTNTGINFIRHDSSRPMELFISLNCILRTVNPSYSA